MKPITDGVWQLDGFPAHAVNAFFADGILFDCRTRWAAGGIARQLRGRTVELIALTHAHPDHCGSAAELSVEFGARLAVHADDAGIMTAGELAGAHMAFVLGKRFMEGGPVRDVVELHDGDRIGDFSVVHTPGHSAGHVVYFRESDRLAITGDLFSTMDPWTRRRRLAEPPAHLSVDPRQNRRSIQKLLELRPSLVLPGHGPAVSDMDLLAELVARLELGEVRETAASTAG